MAFDQERLGPELPHRVVLEDRSRLTVSGVEEVERFDENTVVLSTAQLGNNWRPYEDIDFEISNQMISALTAFAKTGNPNCDEIPDWQSGYKLPMRFCEDTHADKWETKKLLKNTFSNNGAEF